MTTDAPVQIVMLTDEQLADELGTETPRGPSDYLTRLIAEAESRLTPRTTTPPTR